MFIDDIAVVIVLGSKKSHLVILSVSSLVTIIYALSPSPNVAVNLIHDQLIQ